MATSGSFSFRTNRLQIIQSALRLVGGYDIEATGPTVNQISTAGEALNLIIKSLSSRRITLSSRRYGVIFPQKDQGVYILGTPNIGGDHATLTTPLGVGGFFKDTLTVPSPAASLLLTLNTLSYTGTAGIPAQTILSGDPVGIVLDSGEIFWTTASSTATSPFRIIPDDPLPSDASAGNVVYSYKTKIMRPQRITDAFIRYSSGTDTDLEIISKDIYNSRSGKQTTSGVPSELMYDPQTHSGQVYVYPKFSSVSDLLFIEFEKPLDDMTSDTHDYDLNQEWGEYLKYRLALALGPEHEISDIKFKQLSALMTASFMEVSPSDQENASVFLQPQEM